MNKISLAKILGLFALSLIFCSSLEAASGASKAYKVSVTVPPAFHAQARIEQGSQAQAATMQIAMEQDIRNSQGVVLKTVVAK